MARPSPEACARRIASLDPFVLECGHYPDLDFRGTKQVGETFTCVGCYRGEPPTAPAPETQVSDETRALLAANYPSAERCPRCGGTMIVHAKTKARGAYVTCAAECEKNARMREREEIERIAPPGWDYNVFEKEKEPVIQALVPAQASPLTATDTRTIPYALEEKRPALAQATAESAQALAVCREAFVRSPEALEWASTNTKYAKDWIDFLEAEREKLNRPLLDEKARVDEVFMPAIKNWQAVERDLKAKMGAYHLAQRQEQERVMRESSAVYQQGGIPTAPIPVVVQAEGVGVRETWAFEIVDENAVPREFCSPSASKIEIAREMWMKGAGEPPAIPGVRFYKSANVSVRRK